MATAHSQENEIRYLVNYTTSKSQKDFSDGSISRTFSTLAGRVALIDVNEAWKRYTWFEMRFLS